MNERREKRRKEEKKTKKGKHEVSKQERNAGRSRARKEWRYRGFGVSKEEG